MAGRGSRLPYFVRRDERSGTCLASPWRVRSI